MARPLILAIVLGGVILALAPMVLDLLRHRVQGGERSVSRQRADLVFSLILLALLVWMVREATGWTFRTALFPVAVGLVAVGLAALQLILALKFRLRPCARARADSGRGEPADAESLPPDVVHTRTVQMVGWVLAIAVGTVLLGFEFGAGLLTFLFLRFAAHERLSTCVLVAGATYVSAYILFDRVLLIPFPPGTLAETFGLDKPLDHYVVDPLAALIAGH